MEKNLEQLQQELAEDIKINLIGLQQQIANNPYLYSKWLNYFQNVKFLMKQAENEKSRTLKARLDYYTGREGICMESYEKSELKIVLAADTELQKADQKLYVLSLKLDFIREALEAIKQRGFALKNILDRDKFEQGEF